MNRWYVAVCVDENDKEKLFRFNLPENEKWQGVTGEEPDGSINFKNNVKAAEDYALGHLMSGNHTWALKTVFHSSKLGKGVPKNLDLLPLAESLIDIQHDMIVNRELEEILASGQPAILDETGHYRRIRPGDGVTITYGK